MPRPSKGPRLYKRAARPEIGRKAVWIIRDGDRDFATGCVASPTDKGPPEAAQQALADHIATKYRPERKAKTIEVIDVADVLTIYVDDKGDEQASRSKFEGRILRLNSFWGGLMLSEVSTATCKEYAKKRGAKWIKSADGQERIVCAGGARRDLEDLRAAIGHHAAENLHREIVNVWLPPKGAPRERWLTRSEAAKLIWTCWRYRETQTCHRGPLKGQKIQTDKRPLRHLARFLLVGLYTGTRAGAIATASPIRGIGRSFIDLDGGIFYRLAQGRRETNKRQPPAPIPPRLLAHMRRWVRLGIASNYFVEWRGKPVKSVKTALNTATRLAGLSKQGGNVTPHTLRHTAATWLMQAGVPVWTAAGYLGMSVEVLLNTYGHHHPDYLREAANAFGGRSAKKNVSVVESVVGKNSDQRKSQKR
ncbi:phage integrase [Rhodoplanes sp. Z2-YC6860]|nr:site-specific integrase [Rhodoplanes sp. Z2-YC6860]AMN40413.1 phage integrase [Rhodoplanes sp. Z2-YC6860]